jgi:hypothetical protein
VQRAQLHDDKKQEEHARQAGIQEVLPSLPDAHGPPRKQVAGEFMFQSSGSGYDVRDLNLGF